MYNENDKEIYRLYVKHRDYLIKSKARIADMLAITIFIASFMIFIFGKSHYAILPFSLELFSIIFGINSFDKALKIFDECTKTKKDATDQQQKEVKKRSMVIQAVDIIAVLSLILVMIFA